MLIFSFKRFHPLFCCTLYLYDVNFSLLQLFRLVNLLAIFIILFVFVCVCVCGCRLSSYSHRPPYSLLFRITLSFSSFEHMSPPVLLACFRELNHFKLSFYCRRCVEWLETSLWLEMARNLLLIFLRCCCFRK